VEFSPDGRSYAYVASVAPGYDSQVVVRDGREVHSFKLATPASGVAFSPDSRHLAYFVWHNGFYPSIAVDGEEAIPIYDFVPFQSRIVFDTSQNLHTIAVRNGEVLLVEASWKE